MVHTMNESFLWNRLTWSWQGHWKILKFYKNELRYLFQCFILIPRKCPRKTLFQYTRPPCPPVPPALYVPLDSLQGRIFISSILNWSGWKIFFPFKLCDDYLYFSFSLHIVTNYDGYFVDRDYLWRVCFCQFQY